VNKKLTGPALAGVEDRWPDKKNLYAWIKNSAAFLKTGDAYANKLYNEYNKVAMNNFPGLSDADIDAILAYIKTVPAPGAAPAGGAATAGAPEDQSDSTLVFGLLTLILAVVSLILLQVNSNLKKLSDDKEGVYRGEPVPFYRNKTYLMAGILVMFAVGGYYTISGAIDLGRMKNYQPDIPLKRKYYNDEGIISFNIIKLFEIIVQLNPRITRNSIDLVHKIVFKSGWIDKWNSLEHYDRLLYYHLFGLILELDENALDFNYISSKRLLQQLFINRGTYIGINCYLELNLQQQKFKSFCILQHDIYSYTNDGNRVYFGLETAYTGEEDTFSDDVYMLLIYGSKYIDKFANDIMKTENFEHLIVGINLVEDIQDNNLLEQTKNYWENNGFLSDINEQWGMRTYENYEYEPQQGGRKHKIVYRKKSKSSKKKRKSSKTKRKSSKTKRKSSRRK
jgi:hypothetical protein